MTSVASGGTAERIVARILLSVLRAGSGILARYSSTSFGATLAFAVERLLPDFAFFIMGRLPAQPRWLCHVPSVVIPFGRRFKLGRLCGLGRRRNFLRRSTELLRPYSGDSWRAGRDGE